MVCVLVVPLTPAYALDITLQWDANRESDVAGYRLWYRVGSSGPPYDCRGAYEEPSPVAVGNVTQFTLHNLDDNQEYYFTLTAYDVEENQSYFSNEVSTDDPDGSSGISGGSSGVTVTESSSGGSGCFIGVASY